MSQTQTPSAFSPADIEARARAHWEQTQAYRVLEHAPHKPAGPYYACSMLPYPSGRLHMGHVRNYTLNDVMARSLRMQGYNVLMPMGWDAFGLPAENAAMANRKPPAAWTYENIEVMRGQMKSLGLAIDWSREIATCRPEYYRWNQWLFLKMREAGIAYLKTGTVNWDPVDKTVLANEQVVDGRGWRSGAVVEKREIPMYYFAITRYADELISGLEGLGWPERVKTMQENWIGRSVGVRFAFPHEIRTSSGPSADGTPLDLLTGGRLYVFTTRADTLMGVSFVAVAPEHPIAQHAAELEARAGGKAIAQFIAECQTGGVSEADIATREKAGIDTGLKARHPITGEELPIWIGNYVLMGYGDGAVMAVPAHDERDFEFANKYGLPVRQVMAPADDLQRPFSTTEWADWYAQKDGMVCVNSGPYNGLGHAEAVDAVARDLAILGLGEKRVQVRLRDWGISRQRYWGTPIPIIHCPHCGEVPVPEQDLPVVLPEDLVPDGSGNPLNHCASFLNVDCPSCGAPARRETDTMDTFVDSCWYYLRYCCPDSDGAMVDERVKYWMPMNQYIGGIEHAVLHLLYARFWTKVMRDLGLVDFAEPFQNLLTQGMVLNDTYFRVDAEGRKVWFNPAEVEVQFDDKGRPTAATLKSDGKPVEIGGVEKMSKSKNNGIDPQRLIDQYGADTARLFTLFAAPPEQTLDWNPSGVEGAHRFLRRLWTWGRQCLELAGWSAAGTSPAASLSDAGKALRRDVHEILAQADFDYGRRQYNTVVSACMKLLNALEDGQKSGAEVGVLHEGLGILLRLLYPVVPHTAWALWTDLGYARLHGDLLDAPWPQVDESARVRDTLKLMLQVNGKLRGELEISASAGEEEIRAAALASEAFEKFSEGRPLKKAIVVPGRLVNLVV